jgi:orotate phosphoribosyltransferase
MADSAFNFENRLRALGVVEHADFTTAAGEPANVKINLENVIDLDYQLAAEIAGILAVRLALEKPDLIIPVPEGANSWAEQSALHLDIGVVKMKWLDKKTGKLRATGVTDINKIRQSERIALIDDVFTTGSSIKKVVSHRDIAGKVVVAGVVWNRSKENPKMDFPVATVIDSYVPLAENG